jgi:short-subunit dehydrogenase
MRESRLVSVLGSGSAAAVARAGYDGMMAGDAIVIPGLGNKLGVQAVRVAPRALVRRMIRFIQSRRS